MKKLKILELCQFSAGICGVWNRVRQEAQGLSKLGHEVRIFSSNATKGSPELACNEEKINNIRVKRFSFKKLGGESFMKWDFEKEALEYSPEIIIAHVYRHPHTTRALKIAEKLRNQGKSCKVFLVTHAPFVPDNSTRSLIAKITVNFYDSFIGRKTLNKFNKIITISNWEKPYILKAGAKKEKLVYLPNGIPKEFFTTRGLAKEENKILFFGRVSPIKDIETVIQSIPLLEDSKLIFEIVGPAEVKYLSKLKGLIIKKSLQNRIRFSEPIYDLQKKIKKIDSCKIFILPSKKEGMPQSLVEAMARSKMVLGSDIAAITDLIRDGKNGYLFKQGNEKSLANKINLILSKDNSQLKKKAKSSVQSFEWDKIIRDLERLF